MSGERNAARERARMLREQAQRAERRRNVLIRGGLVAVVAVAVLAATIGVLAARDDDGGTAASAAKPSSITAAGGVLRGSASAKVTVQVFEDFLCPFCRTFEQESGSQLTEWAESDDVAVEYVPVNLLDDRSSDDYSSRAANAAACVYVDDPEAWKPFHDALYDRQPEEGGPGLPDSTLASIAKEAGAGDVSSCIANQSHVSWISQATEDSGIPGTPTVKVNGQPLEDTNLEALRAAVDQALQK